MRRNANCFACGAKIDLTDEESYTLVPVRYHTNPRVCCANYDCETVLETGPDPQDDTPFLDTSFDDHELMKDSKLFAGTVADYKRAVNNGLSVGLSKVIRQEVAQ